MLHLLDCTLREAPLDELMWGDFSIRKMMAGLERANINIIEVGFLKDGKHHAGSTIFNKVEEIRPYLSKKKDYMYVALVDYGRYNLENLSNYDGTSIDAIRVCFKKNEINDVINFASQIREKGYKVCIQHVDTLGYTEDEVLNFIKKINDFKPYSYSIVDTFGAMYEEDLLHIVSLLDAQLDHDIWLGFHGHNNLMLADANAQDFIRHLFCKRNIIVDSTLYGCGRSAGNAHTELLAQYINKHIVNTYGLNELLDLIETVIVAVQQKTTWGYSIPFFIAGMYNAHSFNVKHLMERHNLRFKDLRGIIEKLDCVQKKGYDYALLESVYAEYFNRPVDDSAVIENLTEKLNGKIILALGPGKSIIYEKERIYAFIRENNPIMIGINNLIEGYILDYVFYSSAIRFQNIRYQDYKGAGEPQLILSSNVKTDQADQEMIVDYNSLIKYGWINIDSSMVLFFRLLIKCGIKTVYAAGLDGYVDYGDTFYNNEFETGKKQEERKKNAEENYSMLKDIKHEHPEFNIKFITDSFYSDVFEKETDEENCYCK